MKKIFMLLFPLVLSLGFTMAPLEPVTVSAQNNVVKDQLCKPGQQLDPGACGDAEAALFSPNGLVDNILNVLSMFMGAVAIIVIVVAGFRFMLSGGDPQTVASARNQILYAIVGIVVAIFAQAIVRFVLTET